MSNQEIDKMDRYRKRKILIWIISITMTLMICVGVGYRVYWAMPKTVVFTEDAQFSKSMIEAKTKEIIQLLNNEDFDKIRDQYADEIMKKYLTKDLMKPAMNSLSTNWGGFVSYGNTSYTKMMQKSESFVTIQIDAVYDNIKVTYTLTYNKDQKLVGLYMK